MRVTAKLKPQLNMAVWTIGIYGIRKIMNNDDEHHESEAFLGCLHTRKGLACVSLLCQRLYGY